MKSWGKGRPVVLLHGWPLSSDTFDALSMALAYAGLRAIAYDRRGFGRSEQPWRAMTTTRWPTIWPRSIEATGANNATLLGFSMGGGEVARYMSRHRGAHVSQAVLIASVVPYMLKTADNANGVDQSIFDAMAEGIQADRAAFWTGFFKRLLRCRDGVAAGERRSARVVAQRVDASQPQGDARLRDGVCDHRLSTGPGVVQGADADRPRHQRQDRADRHLARAPRQRASPAAA